MLLLLHSAFILGMVKMLLKGEVGGSALNSHVNYIVDQGKSWKNNGIVFLNFCGNPVINKKYFLYVIFLKRQLSMTGKCHYHAKNLQQYLYG